jgi:hypothetical protein
MRTRRRKWERTETVMLCVRKKEKKNETEKNDQILIAFGVITFSPHELPKNARCPH